jgi:hypothetical protein
LRIKYPQRAAGNPVRYSAGRKAILFAKDIAGKTLVLMEFPIQLRFERPFDLQVGIIVMSSA